MHRAGGLDCLLSETDNGGKRMASHPRHEHSDSRADAAAILGLIVLVVIAAVFWVSQQ